MMESADRVRLTLYTKEGIFHGDRVMPNPIPCEVSTMWLGVENPGMNVAMYIPGYRKAPLEGYPCMVCCYPGGRLEIVAE